MNTKEKFVVTINRELGSGGRTVGEKVAAKLGVSFYDKAVIKSLTAKYHLSTEAIENLKGLKHDWWSDFKRTLGMGLAMGNPVEYYIPVAGDEPYLLTADDVFETECEILKGIAAEESCVIAGRLGFFLMKDHPNHISVLIQAPKDYRIARVMEKQGLSREEAEKAIDKVDKLRENYVKHYADTSRYDARNYDLVINSAGKTEDEIASLILSYMQE
jgi:cytidylate kinase